MNKKLLSICVLCYNHEKYLEKNFQSIWDSKIKDVEIIVVDDGSKDNSAHIIQRLKEQSPCTFISVLQENSGNIGHNFNVALKQATGEFVTFISADDYYDSKELVNNYNILQENPNYAFVASTKIKEVDSKNEIVKRKNEVPPLIVDGLDNPSINDLLELEYGSLGVFYIQGCLFRKKIVDEVNGFDEDLAGDDIILRTKIFRYLINHKEYSYYINHNACCYYRRHDNNVSKNVFRQMKIVSEYLERYWPDRSNPSVFYEWLFNSFECMDNHQIFELFSLNQRLNKCLTETEVVNHISKAVFNNYIKNKLNNRHFLFFCYRLLRKIVRVLKRIRYNLNNNKLNKIATKERKVIKQIQAKYKGDCILSGNKTAIVMCDDAPIAKGGLCDRLRGIVSVYQSCKIHNIDFKLNFVSPFQLSDFLVPNKYDWRINKSDIQYNSKSLPLFVFTKNGDEIEALLQRQMVSDDLRKNYNQLHFWTNAHYSLTSGTFYQDFNELFKPSDKLNAELEKYLHQINSDYISVSFRFIQLLNDFEEHYNVYPVLPVDEQKLLIEQCLNVLKDLYQKESKQIFVATDSITFLKAAKTLPFVYVIDGDIVHVDAAKESSFDNHKKTFIDFFMISNATKVYLAHRGQMFYSGFPRTAALAGNKQFEIIEF